MSDDSPRAGGWCDSSLQTAGTGEAVPRLDTDGHEIPALARRAVETYVRERRVLSKDRAPAPLLLQRIACFVSIKTTDGDLRGCIGTIEPARPTLAEEIIRNAVHAATQDPRFHPVEERELARLCFSVDILSEPEMTRFECLDPSVYGVIVEDEGGSHRGLLLPDIAGIETATQQVQIAARKAGIAPDTPLRLYRFRVTRFHESGKQTSSDQGVQKMADDKVTGSSLGEKTTDSGMAPATAPDPVSAVNPADDGRSLDVGESGQFAPGGRYNQLEATKPRRIDLDEQVDSALRDDK